jgi:hypothetical protein
MQSPAWSPIDGDGNVICLPSPDPAPRLEPGQGTGGTTGNSPVEDLCKYDTRESDEDYRHRMLVNLLAAIVIVVLMLTASWVVDTLARTRDSQSCYRPAPINCAAGYAPSRQHG